MSLFPLQYLLDFSIAMVAAGAVFAYWVANRRRIAAETGAENPYMAGGVALNCMANCEVLRDGKFKRVWVQPASGTSGGRGTPVLPSPAEIDAVNSASSGSSTACPRAFASCMAQTTRLA